jgi:hypothetical protein
MAFVGSSFRELLSWEGLLLARGIGAPRASA